MCVRVPGSIRVSSQRSYWRRAHGRRRARRVQGGREAADPRKAQMTDFWLVTGQHESKVLDGTFSLGTGERANAVA